MKTPLVTTTMTVVNLLFLLSGASIVQASRSHSIVDLPHAGNVRKVGATRRLQGETLKGFKKTTTRDAHAAYPHGSEKGSKKTYLEYLPTYHDDDYYYYYYYPEEEVEEDEEELTHHGNGFKSEKYAKSKSAKSSKQSKKGKTQKKMISKKLKKSSDDYGDDDYYYHWDYPYPAMTYSPNDKHSTSSPTLASTDAPVAANQESVQNPTASSGIMTRMNPVLQQTVKSAVVIADDSEYLRPNHHKNIVGQNTDRHESRAQIVAKNKAIHGPAFTMPTVKRNVYPGVVQLKAHSSYSLSEKDPQIFAILQEMLTPYLRDKIGDSLSAYNLQVVYEDGEDASNFGVIVTNIAITIILSVENDDLESLNGITHQYADSIVEAFFTGSELYELLGELRKFGVEVNEIVALEEEFRSPIFQNSVAGVSTTGSRNSPSGDDEKNSRFGLIASLFVGMVIVGSVLFAHNRGALPIEDLSHSIREAFSSDAESQASSSQTIEFEKEASKETRQRSWSGSFRRFPDTGVKPAAIQKSPAFSSQYLKKPDDNASKPAFDEQSYSVAGDYNVPEEYDFKQSPIADVYSPRRAMIESKPTEDEFSMPEDYNTVTDDMSLYSQSVKGKRRYPPATTTTTRLGGSGRPRGINPFEDEYSVSPSTGGFTSPMRRGMQSDDVSSYRIPEEAETPRSQAYIDEWSVASASFATPSPAQPLPYRHWKHDSTTPSPKGRSQLRMPRLS